MNLAGAHVLVTGGTDGIGLALARQLLHEGARLTICGRSEARCESARVQLGPAVHVVRHDVADFSGHAQLLAQARQAHGPIDVLVNNAAIQQPMNFTREAPARGIASEVAINLTAPMLLTEAVLPELLGRPRAAIVHVTSGLALSPKAGAPVYCATKSGLRTFARALRWQLEGTRVRVVEVLPPLVDTAMTRGRGRGKLSPDAVAREIVAALRTGKDEVFVGKTRLLRWLVALSPWLAGRISRRM